MKITKFVHSCVLIEDGDYTILFDPGIFSWLSGLIEITKLPKLSAVVVTHKHKDHLGDPFVSALAMVQPDIQWIAPPDAHEKLMQLGVKKVTDKSFGGIEVVVGQHADITPLAELVQNLTVNYADKLTDPGDSHEFTSTKPLLLMPVDAPWGSTAGAARLVTKLKPKYVLPIHDSMWHDDWRQNWYAVMRDYFKTIDVTFLTPTNGQPIELDL